MKKFYSIAISICLAFYVLSVIYCGYALQKEREDFKEIKEGLVSIHEELQQTHEDISSLIQYMEEQNDKMGR